MRPAKIIPYAGYMAMAIPVGLLAVGGILLVFRFVLKPDVSCLKSFDIKQISSSMKPADRKEKISVAVFFFVCALWILPSLLKPLIPTVVSYISGFGTAMPPLLGTVLLCVLCVDGEPIMDVRKAMASVPWAPILMAAATLVLGSTMTDPNIGLTSLIADAVAPVFSNVSTFAFAAIIIAFTALMTNVATNMVTLTLACTLAIPVCTNMGYNTAAICALIGMISCYAFSTPAAMTTVVLGTGSGWTTTAYMAKYGFLIVILSILIAVGIGYPIASLAL
jgi:sodium-dependent dicarboxylate transporter 2/3/5